MRPYFLDLIERGTVLTPPDAKAVASALLAAFDEMRAGRNPLADGGIVTLLASSEQLETLHEAQALMSLLEGHSDVVMSSAATQQIPGAKRFAKVLGDRRRGEQGPRQAREQFAGFDAKLRQYAEGERFVEALLNEGGRRAVREGMDVPREPAVARRDPGSGPVDRSFPRPRRLHRLSGDVALFSTYATESFPERPSLSQEQRSTAAVSGGPDSLALMVLAVAAGCDVVAYHVDHGIRAGSSAEARVVASAANRLGVRFVALSVDCAPGANLEARARAARYAALPRGVATGHTADDQAETILLNLMRGAGLDGLSGMAVGPAHPILALRRVETRAARRVDGARGRARSIERRSAVPPEPGAPS